MIITRLTSKEYSMRTGVYAKTSVLQYLMLLALLISAFSNRGTCQINSSFFTAI